MSLDFDLHKIKDWETKCFVDSQTEKDEHGKPARKMRGDLETIIWNTIALDLGKITAENIGEWLWRLAFLRRVGMGISGIKPDGTKWWPNRETLTEFIGLSTNVPEMKRTQWVRTVMNKLVLDTNREMLDAKQAAA